MNVFLSWRSIYGVAVTAFALTVSFAAGPSQAQMGPNAQGAARPANSILVFLKRIDVLLSPRHYRKEWRKAFEDFSATKIVWTYGAERFFQDTGLGNIPMQCTLLFWTRAKEPEHEKLVCRTRNGEPVGMQFAGSPVRQYYPDVLAPEWLERQIAAGKSLADRGCRHFMQDDPPLNVSRISQRGCFSQEMSERYERFLKGNNLADSRQSLESFQKEVVLNYHRALHAAIR